MKKTRTSKRLRLERILLLVSGLSILAAWFVGGLLAQEDIQPLLDKALPAADSFRNLEGDTYAGYRHGADGELVGYVAVAEAVGYGGPLQVAVALDPAGEITGVQIVDHKETPSYLKRVLNADYLESLIGVDLTSVFPGQSEVDVISGATYSSRGIAVAAAEGSRRVIRDQLGKEVPQTPSPSIQFGVPEFTLVALFGIGFLGQWRKFKYKKQIRWISMLVGMVVLGFVYTQPLTLSDINKLIMGFWPTWQDHIYWYLLVFGVIFTFLIENKNPYCQWFCPFGALQECMGLVGGAKTRPRGKYKSALIWIQRGLAWLAVMLAVFFRNPGLTSFEVFGTAFDLNGSTLQFALLGIVLVASLFIRRPWCAYLCPLDSVTGWIKAARKWILELWENLEIKKFT